MSYLAVRLGLLARTLARKSTISLLFLPGPDHKEKPLSNASVQLARCLDSIMMLYGETRLLV